MISRIISDTFANPITFPTTISSRVVGLVTTVYITRFSISRGKFVHASITADTDVECYVMDLEDFESLAHSHPGIKIKLLENLCLGLCRKLRKANRELGMLD